MQCSEHPETQVLYSAYHKPEVPGSSVRGFYITFPDKNPTQIGPKRCPALLALFNTLSRVKTLVYSDANGPILGCRTAYARSE
jgi:hypothetical protein